MGVQCKIGHTHTCTCTSACTCTQILHLDRVERAELGGDSGTGGVSDEGEVKQQV